MKPVSGAIAYPESGPVRRGGTVTGIGDEEPLESLVAGA
jgi:hypothetical protein